MPEDVIWLAGYLDGEGCFSLGASKGYYSVQVNVASTNVDVLRWVQWKFGGHLRMNVGVRNHKDYWHLGWRRHELQTWLHLVVPYLKLKQRQAEIILLYINKYNSTSNGGKFIQDPVREYRTSLFDELRVLNKRGKSLFS